MPPFSLLDGRQFSEDGSTGRLRAVLFNVDLRPLQFSAVVDVHRLDLGELLDGACTRLAMAVSSRLDPTERKLDLRADCRCVHVRDACLQLLHRSEGKIDVLRVDGARKSV